MSPAYISEVSLARYRGRLSTLQQIAIIAGLFLSFVSNYFLAKLAGSSTAILWMGFEAWRWMFWVQILPAALFLIALHVRETQIEVYRAAELGGIEASTKSFLFPVDFEIAEYDHGVFGLGAPARSREVTVEFDARTPDAVRQRKVHPRQKTEVARDGRFRVSFVAADMGAVAAWILASGGFARALQPDELVQRVLTELSTALKHYA